MATTARKTNWFAIWVSIAVVVVLGAVTALVVVMNNQAAGPGDKPSASNVNTDTGAISFGTGKDTMDTYIDFMCPICKSFEDSYGESVQKLVSDGTITLNIHPIAILDDRSQGTEFSSRAASAMYSISIHDPAHATAFLTGMYAKQPAEGSSGLTDEEIITIAKDAGVDMTSDLEKEIKAHKYLKYVQDITAKTPIAPGSSGIGTPTIAINGTVIDNKTLPAPDQLNTLFK